MKLLCNIVCFLTLFFSVYAEEPTSYVTCMIGSQLGNQIFMISTALVTAWEHGATPIFPELHRSDYNIPLNRKKIFFRLNADDIPKVQWNHFALQGSRDNFKVYYQPVHYQPNLYINGWNWQTSYFDPYKDRLIDLFSPSEEEEIAIQQQYGELLKMKKLVGVHIRAYDPSVFYFLGLNYFKKAMDIFPDDYCFAIFSCRPDWVKKHLEGYKPNMVFIKGNDHVRDFFLLNKCKHKILSNSTFSFWAAYLSNDPDQIVIAPDLYLPDMERFSAKNGAYPKEWIVLKVPRSNQQPTDIINYSTESIDRG